MATEGKGPLSYLAALGSSSSGLSGKVTASQRPVLGPVLQAWEQDGGARQAVPEHNLPSLSRIRSTDWERHPRSLQRNSNYGSQTVYHLRRPTLLRRNFPASTIWQENGLTQYCTGDDAPGNKIRKRGFSWKGRRG